MVAVAQLANTLSDDKRQAHIDGQLHLKKKYFKEIHRSSHWFHEVGGHNEWTQHICPEFPDGMSSKCKEDQATFWIQTYPIADLPEFMPKWEPFHLFLRTWLCNFRENNPFLCINILDLGWLNERPPTNSCHSHNHIQTSQRHSTAPTKHRSRAASHIPSHIPPNSRFISTAMLRRQHSLPLYQHTSPS